MAHRTLLSLAETTTLALAAVVLIPTTHAADGATLHGRIRHIEGDVTLQRSGEGNAESAEINAPFLPGDRIWSGASGRAEFQFPEGGWVWLDQGAKLDMLGRGDDSELALELWSGSLRVQTDERAIEISSPGGRLRIDEDAAVRIDADASGTVISVFEGEARLDSGRGDVEIESGRRFVVEWGAAAPQTDDLSLGSADEFD